MSKVLVLGATGYIGRALCLSLIRSGNHLVYGLARTPAKAADLTALEIIPVVGDIESNTSAWTSLIDSAHIDVVVDVTGAGPESAKLLEHVKRAGRARTHHFSPGADMTTDKAPRKLGFIYTSGTWVHGSSKAPVNDLDFVGVKQAPTQPSELVAWRPDMERKVLAAHDVLDTMVVRPALVYGGVCPIWSLFFRPIYQARKAGAGPATVKADHSALPGLVHVEDVASGLHAAVEKLPLIAGTNVYPVFDLVSSSENLGAILSEAANAMEFKGEVKFEGPGNDQFAVAMNTSFNGSSGRARTILGWEPKITGMVNRIDLLVKAWMASQK